MKGRVAPKDKDTTTTNAASNPRKLDSEKADALLKKIVRENKEWFKEMANK